MRLNDVNKVVNKVIIKKSLTGNTALTRALTREDIDNIGIIYKIIIILILNT